MHLKKINSPDFPGFDKNTPLTTALKTPLTTHLSTPSSHPPPLLRSFQTPTPTSTSVSSSSITTFEPYIPLNSKTTHQLSNPASSSPITVPSSSHPRPRPSTTTITFLYSSSLVLANGTNTSISLLMLHTQKNTFQFQKCIP